MSSSLLDLSTEFAGRRAIVTGGSRGIGAAITQRLLDGGATVVAAARTRTDDTPDGATFISADLRTEAGAKKLATAALEELGGLDILINNAGAARAYPAGSNAISDTEWQDSLDANLLSAVRLTNAVIPALRESTAAAIVNVSSGGATPLPGPLLHYGAAKAGLNAYTLGLAAELAPAGIRVNIVTPGPVISPGGDEIRDTVAAAMGMPTEAMTAIVPMRRFGDAHDVAEMVALLTSDRGAWMTMHNYFVDGGMGAT